MTVLSEDDGEVDDVQRRRYDEFGERFDHDDGQPQDQGSAMEQRVDGRPGRGQ